MHHVIPTASSPLHPSSGVHYIRAGCPPGYAADTPPPMLMIVPRMDVLPALSLATPVVFS
jgi:hypothetical protein